MCSTDIFLGVLALLFPPLPVWVKCGICSADSIINILLCVLGFLPGLLHAWYIIAKHPEPSWEYEALPDSEQGHGRPAPGGERVTYVFVRDDGHRCEHSSQSYHAQNPRYNGPAQPKRQGQQQHAGYGTQQGRPASMPGTYAQVAAAAAARQEEGVTVDRGSAAGPSSRGGAPEDGSVPPSYAEAVGDNKVQRGE